MPKLHQLGYHLIFVAVLIGSICNGVPTHAQDIIVSSLGDNSIKRYNGQTGAFIDSFVPAASGGLLEPRKMVFGPDGNLYVAGSHGVLRYNGTTGAFLDTFISASSSLPSGGIVGPLTHLAFGPDGNLYASDEGNSYISRFDGATGKFIDNFVSSGSGGLQLTTDFLFGPDNNLYVANFNASGPLTGSVKRYNGNNGAYLGDFASPGYLFQPLGLAFGPDHNLYVSDAFTNEVTRFDGATGQTLDGFGSAASGLLNARGLTFGPDGNVYVVSSQANTVMRYNGSTHESMGVFASGEGLDHPMYVAFLPSPAAVPEMSTWILFGILLALGAISLRRIRNTVRS